MKERKENTQELKENTQELVLTPDKPKRTRTVIKWQDAHEKFTCEAIAIFVDNKDIEPSKIALVGRKLQFVLESVAQTVKDGRVGKEMIERRDNLELALGAANITTSNVIACLDSLIKLFRG